MSKEAIKLADELLLLNYSKALDVIEKIRDALPASKPLTDEQLDAYFAEQWTGYSSYHDCFKEVIKWAEAAHGIK